MALNAADIRGRVRYIEPTNVEIREVNGHVQRAIIQSNELVLNDLEDYCIAVDLEVCIPDRKSCGLANETGENYFIHYSATNGNTSFMHGTSGVLTTNFTDVSVLEPNGATSEMFGIESISITYDSWLYPQVTIKFIDVRGASVMQPEEYAYQNKEGQGSLYKTLFTFPYPTFRLKVKGFYGRGATYYLCVSDTAIELDSSSGNFVLTAKFIGMMYRIYADMPMSFLCIAPYMVNGEEYWNSRVAEGIFKFKNRNGTTSDMIKFPRLREKIADAITSEEKMSAAAEGQKVTHDIDTRIAAINAIESSCPTRRWSFYKIKGHSNQVGYYPSTSEKKEDIGKEIDNFMESVKEYDKSYEKNYESKFSVLNEYGDNNKGYKNIIEVVYEKRKNDVPYPKSEDKNYQEYILGNDAVVSYTNKFVTEHKNENPIKFFIFDSNFNTLNNALDELEREKEGLLLEREQAIERYKELEDALLEEALGFTPSIQNIYNLAFAHMDTFMHVFYSHMKVIKDKIDGNDPSRSVKTYPCENDVNQFETMLPPFPAFYAQKYASKGPNAPKTEIWPGELPGEVGDLLDEVNFVKDLLSATKLYQEADEEARKKYDEAMKRLQEGNTGSDFTTKAPSTSIKEFIPMTTYDYVNKDKMQNPYKYLRSNSYSADAFERNVFATFALRAIYYLSTNKAEDAENFGTIEAVNMAKSIGEDISDEKFWTFIEDLKKKDGSSAINILQGNIAELDGIGNGALLNTNISYNIDDYYPLGQPNLLNIKSTNGSNKSTNPYYIKEKEDVLPENRTFTYFDSRDYIKEVYEKIDAMIDGTSDEEDKKYNLKARKKDIKRYQDNIDYEFDSDDVSTMKGIIRTLDGKKTTLEKIGNDNYRDLIDNHFVKFPSLINESKAKCLFDHDFYKIQDTPAARAYLFLSAMPLKSSRKDKNQSCGIPKESKNGVELKSVLLREGSFYWRQDEMTKGNDPIKTSGYVNGSSVSYVPAKANETYIGTSSMVSNFIKSWFGSKSVETLNPRKNGSVGSYFKWDEPNGCTPSRRAVLKEMFLRFVDEFDANEKFLSDESNYEDHDFSKGLDAEEVSADREALKFINKTFFWVGTVLDYYAGRLSSEDKFKTSRNPLSTAFNAFINSLKRIYKKDMKAGRDAAIFNANLKKVEDPFNNKDLRLSTYNTLKDLYDKWLCSPFNGRETWDMASDKSDFSKFVYMDSFYREIGTDLLVNITKVAEWISLCLPTQNVETVEGSMKYVGKSLYEFLTEVAQHTGGMLFAFPQVIGAVNDEYMADMFRAMPFNSDWDTDSSSFVFVYTYKPSEHIGLDQYEDDGFQLETEQARELLGGNGMDIPAFGVSYGKQNQSFFKNITLNTESNNVTEASIGATLAIASKGSEGARETTLFGQDLYRVKTSYSYQCEFDMMGCVQIMPLMYFQLNNVPFWRGAYMVINVSHQITAGDMTTHVIGVRINKNALPLSDGTLIPSKETAASTADNPNGVYGSGSENTYLPSDDKNTEGNPDTTIRGNIDFDEGNVTFDKPIICLTPAHGPQTSKSAEWQWSSTLIDDYIIPKLSKLTFYDGTSYGSNIQRCNKNGNNTGKDGYSMREANSVVEKYGSLKVISVVPHWNGDGADYFLVMPGYTDKATGKNVRRNDSNSFATILKEEALKVIKRNSDGEFKKAPVGCMRTDGLAAQIKDLSIKNSDGASRLNCACVLTENWFVNYPKSRMGNCVLDRSKLDSTTKWKEKDGNGRYLLMEGWMFDEEGMNAISDMHVEAIRRYINNLHERVQTMNTTSNYSAGGDVLSEDIYVRCANEIGCEVAALKAVKMVESNGKAFLSNGKPPILFEGHVFWRNLSNPQQHVAGNEDILYSKWTKKYYKGGLAEYDRLERAKAIDETAALKAASWGLFQILGENYRACGCSTVQEFVNKMCESADNQLLLATKFICSNSEMKNALVRKDWAAFARKYNGAGYKENKYDTKLQEAYNKIKNAQ